MAYVSRWIKQSPDHKPDIGDTGRVRWCKSLWLLVMPLLGLSALLVFRLAEWLKNSRTFYAGLSLPLAFRTLLRQWNKRKDSAERVLVR